MSAEHGRPMRAAGQVRGRGALTRGELDAFMTALGAIAGNIDELAAADDVILCCGESTLENLRCVADEARHGRLGVLIATIAARRAEWLRVIVETAPRSRLAVVLGGNASAWLREGGNA
jgi:hypothetical protein